MHAVPIISRQGFTNWQKHIHHGSPREIREGARDMILGTAWGQWSLLLAIFTVLIILGTICWSLTGGNDEIGASFHESLWMSYTLFIDPGTQTGIAAAAPVEEKLVAVFFSICGFVFNLAVLGLVVDMIRDRLQRWKTERGRIIANGHVLILGWGEKSLFLLIELLAAEAKEQRTRCVRCCGRRRRDIVILAEKSTLDMRQEVKMHLSFWGTNTEGIYFREGDPTDLTELMKVSASSAEDVLVMSSGQGGRSSDQEVIQVLLALAALPQPLDPACDVFAEVQSPESLEAVQPLLPIAEGIIARDAVNQMLVLRALIPSVGYCYLDLVSHNHGNDLYLRAIPDSFVGMPFGEVCRHFPGAVVCGLRGASRAPSKAVTGPLAPPSRTVTRPLTPEFVCGVPSEAREAYRLLPARDRLLQEGDRLVLLTPGGSALGACDAVQASSSSSHPATARRSTPTGFGSIIADDGQWKLGPEPSGPVVILMVGCPQDLPNFLGILDLYLARGSVVHVLSQKPIEAREEALQRHVDSLSASRRKGVEGGLFDRISVVHHLGPTTEKRALAELPLLTAGVALVLSEYLSDDEAPSAVDSRNLTALILLRALLHDCGRDVAGKTSAGRRRCKIVTELLDPKSRRVVEGNDNVRKLGSFVYSAALETGVFTMAAQDKANYCFLMELLAPSERTEHIVAVPSSAFVGEEELLSYYDLYDRVWQSCGSVLLGWQREGARYPELNPASKAKAETWRSGAQDVLLLLRPHRLTPRLQKDEVTPISALLGGGVTPPNCLPLEGSCVP